MAPVLSIVTMGDTSHEDASQGRSGDRYLSAVLLFSHHRDEFDVRFRFGVADFLGRRVTAVMSRFVSTPDQNPRHPVRTLRTATVHGLERHVSPRLTNDDAEITLQRGQALAR
jgi:hypothetical protein